MLWGCTRKVKQNFYKSYYLGVEILLWD
jgi:hypothetical protein